ncbi:MAG: hypothetical protein ACI9XO_000774 [Paraglaciecola sp.]|jgi:hypothetical protein
MEIVLTSLKRHILPNEQNGGHSDNQTNQIDARNVFVLYQMSPRDL